MRVESLCGKQVGEPFRRASDCSSIMRALAPELVAALWPHE